MSALFLMMIALVGLWFVISYLVINYDRKMQNSFNEFLEDERKVKTN